MQEELRLETLRGVRERLRPMIAQTPVWNWTGDELESRLGGTEVTVKLELFQHTGTFKARGALNVILNLSDEQRARGVTAVSAGNHAVATAWAARRLGVDAKILMPKSANPYRVELTRRFGAEILFAESHHAMFEMVKEVQAAEGRTFIHPFEGPFTVQGTATAGLEFIEQAPAVDVMILPIGGGGLCAGFASALKQAWPQVTVYGVEPVGANSMYLSFQSGKPETLEAMHTIADSLAPPRAEPYTFARCREVVDEIVLVDDDQLRDAMLSLFFGLKLAVEPAGAATTAAMLGPLRERCAGRRVGIVVCGANIDPESYCSLIDEARSRRSGSR